MTNTDPENVTIRLPRNLIEQIRAIAVANDRSLSAELRVALREHVRRSLPGAKRTMDEKGRR